MLKEKLKQSRQIKSKVLVQGKLELRKEVTHLKGNMRHLLRNLKDLTFSPVLLENITTLDKTRCKSFNVLHLPLMSLLLLLANMSTMHFAQPTMTITTSSSVNLFILIILFYFCCCCYYSDWLILMLRINTSYRYRYS